MTHHRVCSKGKFLGRLSSETAKVGRMMLEREGLATMNLPGVRDEMCASCASRRGTVPNGCLQTQLDFLKSVVEGDRFCCHAPRDGRLCAGFIAARAYLVKHPLPEAMVEMLRGWEYSPPDEAPTE